MICQLKTLNHCPWWRRVLTDVSPLVWDVERSDWRQHSPGPDWPYKLFPDWTDWCNCSKPALRIELIKGWQRGNILFGYQWSEITPDRWWVCSAPPQPSLSGLFFIVSFTRDRESCWHKTKQPSPVPGQVYLFDPPRPPPSSRPGVGEKVRWWDGEEVRW